MRRVSLEFCDVWPYFEAADQVGARRRGTVLLPAFGCAGSFSQLRCLYRFNLKFAPRGFLVFGDGAEAARKTHSYTSTTSLHLAANP